MNRSLISWLAAIAFIGLGASATIAPEDLSENYGIPIADGVGRAYLRAVGARDAVLGILIAYFLQSKNRSAVTATLAVSALAGAGDFLIVRSATGGAAKTSLSIHAGGTIGLLVAAVLASQSD